MEFSCSPTTLWRDVVDFFCKHNPTVLNDKSSPTLCIIWWAQPDGMSIYQAVSDYLSHSEGPETVYIAPKFKASIAVEKPVLYVWTAASHRVAVKLSLAPQLEFASFFPVPVLTSEMTSTGPNQSALWNVFARADGKMLDETNGAEYSSISWETRSVCRFS